eukprot:Gb_20829 [translate_table: standard]
MGCYPLLLAVTTAQEPLYNSLEQVCHPSALILGLPRIKNPSISQTGILEGVANTSIREVHLPSERILGQFCIFWSFWQFYGPSKPSTRSSPSFWTVSGSSAAQDPLYNSLKQVRHPSSALILGLPRIKNPSISQTGILEGVATLLEPLDLKNGAIVEEKTSSRQVESNTGA